MNLRKFFVVKEDHNVYYEDDCEISSSPTSVLVSQKSWSMKEDHNHIYKDDPVGSSPALGQVPYLDAVVASPPAVPQMVVLFLWAYMMDRSMDFNILTYPG